MRYETLLVWLLGMSFGLVFFDRNMLNYLMVFIKEDITLSDTQIGILASALAIVWAISGSVMGRVSDTIGRRKIILLVAVIGFSIASVSTGLALSFAMLLAARILMGLFEGPVLPVSQTIMSIESSPERRGLNMGLMQNVLANLLGSLAAPIVSVYLAIQFGWRATFFLTIIPGLLLAIAIFVYVKEPVKSRPPRCGADDGDKFGFFAPLKERNILLCMLISGLMAGWMLVGWVFLPVFLAENVGFTARGMSYIFAVLGIVGAAAGFLLPWLSDFIGRKPVVIVFCLLGVLSPLAAIFLGHNPALLVIVLTFGWIAAGTFSVFMATIPAESIAYRQVAASLGLIMGFAELLGGAIMPALAGAAADFVGSRKAIFVIEAVLPLLATILACFLVETAPAKLAPRGHGDSRKPGTDID